MRATYDQKPDKYQVLGNGSSCYRWNIQEVETPDEAGEGTTVKWECDEVIVWNTVTKSKIKEAVITECWDNDTEKKLINDYNAAKEGLFGAVTSKAAKEYIAEYKTFLEQRNVLKEQINEDCLELGII